MMADVGGIALLVRVRNEWDLLLGLAETMEEVVDELWVIDDCSDTSPPQALTGGALPCTMLRADTWSCSSGSLMEGQQRDRLLQEVKRHSSCKWALQLDADERLSDPGMLKGLCSAEDVDGFVLPLMDFYITPDDARCSDERHPERVRSMFGIETRWTLCLYRLSPHLYVPRGDVREPQGLKPQGVRRSPVPLVEHFGKAVSLEEWERKIDFYVEHYPEYRDKWMSRRGKAVHDGLSDFGSGLLKRDDPAYDPRTAPEIHGYTVDTGVATRLKRLLRGRFGLLTNRVGARRVP